MNLEIDEYLSHVELHSHQPHIGGAYLCSINAHIVMATTGTSFDHLPSTSASFHPTGGGMGRCTSFALMESKPPNFHDTVLIPV